MCSLALLIDIVLLNYRSVTGAQDTAKCVYENPEPRPTYTRFRHRDIYCDGGDGPATSILSFVISGLIIE